MVSHKKLTDLEGAYEELKVLDEIKANIISNVSHELRTPITVAKASLELMKDEEDPLAKDMLLNKAIDALDRQNYIIENLIRTARIVGGKTKLRPTEIDIERLVKKTIRDLSPFINKKNVSTKINRDEEIPLIKADKKLITHVLRNLVDNALKFNQPGGEIIIGISKKDSFIEVRVTDTGISIEKEDLKSVFDKFFMADDSPKRRYGGTGMGLAVVKEIIELHGGRIWAESNKGIDSSFIFKLPIKGR